MVKQEQEQRRQKEQERKQTIKEFESLNNNYIREIKTAFNKHIAKCNAETKPSHIEILQ